MKVHAPELMKELVYSYRDAGDYRKALDYSLACQALQDSVFTLSRERTLHENRIRHEIYANERLIDEQRMELMATRHRMILLAVCVAAAVALVLLVYFNYRKKTVFIGPSYCRTKNTWPVNKCWWSGSKEPESRRVRRLRLRKPWVMTVAEAGSTA